MATRGDPEGYYRALGVPRTASADEIRHAFRARAMASHPDRAGETADGETFRLVREAYEVLRDPLRRMAYDASGLAAFTTPGRADEAPSGATERPGPTAPPGTRRPSGAGSARRAEPAGDAAETGAPIDGNWARDAAAGAAWAAGPGQRRQHAGRSAKPRRRVGGTSLWLGVSAAGLALGLLLALGSLWSANRQLHDREAVLADAYDRLARLGEAQAELATRYRSLAFLDLERALQRGGRSGPSAATPEQPETWATGSVTADRGRAAYLHEIAFPGGRFDLGLDQEQALARALVDIAGLIDRLPADADWLIVLEAQAARAAWGEQVAVEIWEPALLRLATVLDAILAQGLPSERFAVRFNAGFAPLPEPADGAVDSALDRVLIKLLCCTP